MILNAIVQGEGPAIILLHGLFGAAKNLGVIARALSTQSQVISLDLRNHGASPHDANMDYAAMASDVTETAAAIGITSALVVGHSMGGKTAMALALTNPSFVEKLVVMDIAPVAYAHSYDDYVQAMQALPLNPGLTRHEAEAALKYAVPEPPMRAFLLNNLILDENPHWRMGLSEIANAMPELIAWHGPLGAKPYTGPALFLHGADSDYVTEAAHSVIRKNFPQAEIKAIPNAAHWLHADQPKAVIAALQAFLFR